jgi:ketosteroid isomerase-like protein
MSDATQSSSELIAAYLDAVMRRDGSIVDRFFHPDIEYIVNGSPTLDPEGRSPPISHDCHAVLPWLGVHRGRKAVKTFLEHMHRNLEVTAFGPREVITEGNKAAAFGWFRLYALSTGRAADISYAIKLELRDGLIAKYYFLENTFDVAGAFPANGAWFVDTDGAPHRVPTTQ